MKGDGKIIWINMQREDKNFKKMKDFSRKK